MKVLAISCHPDDMEICCGGTLLRCVKRGDDVTVCHIANGNMGHIIIEKDKLGKLRIAEAKKAGTDAQATINSYKTTNDNRVANIEADIKDNVKTAIQANANALSGILNGTKLDSFADVEAEIAARWFCNYLEYRIRNGYED